MIKYYRCRHCFHLLVDGKGIPAICPKCKADDTPFMEIDEREYNRLFKNKMNRVNNVNKMLHPDE